jgi:hypothetical protein
LNFDPATVSQAIMSQLAAKTSIDMQKTSLLIELKVCGSLLGHLSACKAYR